MGIKQENEITIKVTCGISELCKILEDKGFRVVDRFTMNDIFMIPNALKNKIPHLTSREILKDAILIRDIENQFKGTQKNRNKKITFKKKEFSKDGDILNQESINCDILNINEAINFFQAINYYRIMNIIENDIVYQKDDFEIAIKDIENGDNLIEVETVSNNVNIDSIEKLKKQIIKLQIPIDTSDFFIKKAEIELDKIIKS